MGILHEICTDYGILMGYATDNILSSIGGSKTGFCAHYNKSGQDFIFIPENTSIPGQIYAGAHELAHILLGHVDCNSPGYALSTQLKEAEANSFAGAFLALWLFSQYSEYIPKPKEQSNKLP